MQFFWPQGFIHLLISFFLKVKYLEIRYCTALEDAPWRCLIPFLSKTKKCLQDSHLVILRIKAKISVFEFFLQIFNQIHGAVSKLVNILISEIWPLTPLLPFTFSLSLLLFFHMNLFFLYFLWFHFGIFLTLNFILKYFHWLLMMTYGNFHSLMFY